MFAKRRVCFVLMIVVLVLPALAILPSAGAQGDGPQGLRPDAPPYAVHGPYAVGTRDFVIDPDGEQPLKITVWYPALNPDNASEAVTYDFGVGDLLPPAMNTMDGHALLNAAPDTKDAPYPLVIYSPGLMASRFNTLYLQEHLASWGFVVVTVDHFGTALIDTLKIASEADWNTFMNVNVFFSHVNRPTDIRRIIGYAENLTAPGGDLANTIDTDHVAVTGHSIGGWTALAAAGARMHFNLFQDWCAQGNYASLIITMVCGMSAEGTLVENEQQLIEAAGIDIQPGELWPSLGDPRVVAAMPISPGGVLTFGDDGLEAVQVPTMILFGSADATAIPEYNAYRVYEHLASAQKSMVIFENGGHTMFVQCSPAWEGAGFEGCSDPVWDIDRAHDLTNHFATAFLLAVLKSDKDAAAALAVDQVSFPGIRYETTGF